MHASSGIRTQDLRVSAGEGISCLTPGVTVIHYLQLRSITNSFRSTQRDRRMLWTGMQGVHITKQSNGAKVILLYEKGKIFFRAMSS
jgi:hypothetical protein